MQDKTFVFAGNREYVLNEMLAQGLNVVRVFAVQGSWLERSLRKRGLEYFTIESKKGLVSTLNNIDFDYFVANGCPFILPVSELTEGNGKVFVNVHPSPLPDLKGADPVPGALLLGRDSGATCHVMDDGIDTGPIVSRVVIPNTPDLDAGLLYQMSFLAEQEAFREALNCGFQPATANEPTEDCVYYSRRPEDLIIDFSEPTSRVLGRIKAFSNRSQGARFSVGGASLRVYDAQVVTNPYLLERIDRYQENEVVFIYERSLLMRHGNNYLKLADIEGDLGVVQVGDTL